MKRVDIIAPRFLSLFLAVFLCTASATLAQTPSPTPQPTPNPDAGNPFAPEKAPPLPAGMTGSNVSDPRFKLTPGMYDAGEAGVGMKHVGLVKTPDAFQLGATDPDDPKVKKALEIFGIADASQVPGSFRLVLAQLAFGNSDLAFSGNHAFSGKLLRDQYLRYWRPGKREAPDHNGLPGRTRRRFGLQKPDVHVGRDAQWPYRLRRTGLSTTDGSWAAGRLEGPFPRRQDIRHHGHFESQASGSSSDVPRFAYAYAGRRSE